MKLEVINVQTKHVVLSHSADLPASEFYNEVLGGFNLALRIHGGLAWQPYKVINDFADALAKLQRGQARSVTFAIDRTNLEATLSLK